MMGIFNHIGTHFDAPEHFIPGGARIGELPLERFVFERPLLLDIPKGKGELIRAADLEPREGDIAGADLLLLRTGFSRYRREEPGLYESAGPGIGPDCAEYLVSSFKGLRSLGIDFVSVGSYLDRAGGTLTHRTLLGGREGHFVCPIEDMNLDGLAPGGLRRVFALPLMVEGVDSAPVTVLAELD
jgi:kynurenine formamidase